jgi:pSer/pThr/pTyr-binding forkhead associated (FHA) protein
MVTIGRAATCDVILSLGTVSKIHGYFLQTEGRWFLVDQRSMNKTYLNGAPVVAGERTPVVSGDRVKFGSEAEFVFEHADALLPRLLASAA